MKTLKFSLLMGLVSTLMSLSVQASDTRDADSGSDHIVERVEDHFNLVASFSHAEFLRGAVHEVESNDTRKLFMAQIEQKLTSREDPSQVSWELLRVLKSEAINLGHTHTLPRTYLIMAKLYLGTNVLPQVPITGSGKVLSEEELVNYLIERLEQFNLSTPIRQSYEYKWALIYHAMLNMKIISHAANENIAKHSFTQALKRLNEAEKLGATKFTYAVLAKLVLTYGDLISFDQKDRANSARSYLDKFYASRKTSEAKKAGDAGERRRMRNHQDEEFFWRKIARPPYFSDSHVQEGAGALLVRAIYDSRPSRKPKMARPENQNANLSKEERSQLIIDTFDAMAQAKGANPKVSRIAANTGYDHATCWRALKDANRIKTKTIAKKLHWSTRAQIKETWLERGYHLTGNVTQHYNELAEEFGCTYSQVVKAIKSPHSINGQKARSRDASPERT